MLEADGVSEADRKELEKINAAMLKQERDLIREEGLAGRPWYKHQIWAPGRTTGYAAQPLPALAEALQDGDKTAVEKSADQLKEVLANAANTARSANE